jgi:hypothetical protein
VLPGRCGVFNFLVPGKSGIHTTTNLFDTGIQRWIYRVDPKRVNEYGQVLVEGEGESKKDK